VNKIVLFVDNQKAKKPIAKQRNQQVRKGQLFCQSGKPDPIILHTAHSWYRFYSKTLLASTFEFWSQGYSVYIE
jgi:hypothetical protein